VVFEKISDAEAVKVCERETIGALQKNGCSLKWVGQKANQFGWNRGIVTFVPLQGRSGFIYMLESSGQEI